MSQLHDFAYISNQKLTSLVTVKPSFWRRPKNFKAQVVVPFGSFAVETADQEVPTAAGTSSSPAVLGAAIDEINKRSSWYADEHVRAGGWIFFDTAMNSCTLDGKHFDSAVIFVDNRELSLEASVRIILHGSARHLTSRQQRVDINADVERLKTAPSSGDFVYALADNVKSAVKLINSGDDPLANPSGGKPHILTSGIIRIIRALDGKFVSDTATWVAGLARVTAIVPAAGQLGDVERIVMATPLYVEYVDPPDDTP